MAPNPRHGPIIHLKARLEAPTFVVTTDVYLSSGLGVYGQITAGGVELREGARLEFSSPASASPFSQPDDELAQVRMRDRAGRVFLVSFNKTYGKRSTFVIDHSGGSNRSSMRRLLKKKDSIRRKYS